MQTSQAFYYKESSLNPKSFYDNTSCRDEERAWSYCLPRDSASIINKKKVRTYQDQQEKTTFVSCKRRKEICLC